MSIERRQRRRKDGKQYMVWRVRWYVGGRESSRTFYNPADARAFEAKARTLKPTDALAEPDPIEAAIARGARPRETLRLICASLARQAALLDWVRLNPGVYSLSRQRDIARAVGPRPRARGSVASGLLGGSRGPPGWHGLTAERIFAELHRLLNGPARQHAERLLGAAGGSGSAQA